MAGYGGMWRDVAGYGGIGIPMVSIWCATNWWDTVHSDMVRYSLKKPSSLVQSRKVSKLHPASTATSIRH